MQYTVWKVYRDDNNPESVDVAREVTAPDTRPNALAAAVTLNAVAPEGVRYEALPLGGSPFDA